MALAQVAWHGASAHGSSVYRWQSQERAQALKMRKMQDTQAEMEDALIELKVHACFHPSRATHSHVELSPSKANNSLCR